jgi:hypothetical protein
MSELTDALERILDFMQQYPTPQDIFLQPGISRTKIEELTNVLPFSLPQELYDLYSWRNGGYSGRGSIAELEFLPIEKAINHYFSTLKDARAVQLEVVAIRLKLAGVLIGFPFFMLIV